MEEDISTEMIKKILEGKNTPIEECLTEEECNGNMFTIFHKIC